MAARAVVASGFAFTRRAGSFADAGVALDEILSLPHPPEPLVLRVTATGGRKAERARVAGDWLCDAAAPELRRIPRPAWSYDGEAKDWSKARTWLQAREGCADARWLLHASMMAGVDPRLVVRAACACVRTVLGRFPPGEGRPRAALEAAEAWASGQSSPTQVRGFASTATRYARDADEAAEAAAAGATEDVSCAAYDAGNAAYDTAQAMGEMRWERKLARLVRLVRGQIPTGVVLRAATLSNATVPHA